jgi:hypothetical protein
MVALQAELDEERRQQRRAHMRCKHGRDHGHFGHHGHHGKHGKHGGHSKHGKHGKHGKDARELSDASSDSSSESSSDSDSEAEGKAKAEEGHHHKHHHHKHGEGRGQHHGHPHRGHGHRGHSHGHGHGHGHHRPTPLPDQEPFANKKLQLETLLYLATLGGAHVCSLQDRIGSFAPGKAFDALHVTINDASGNPSVWGAPTAVAAGTNAEAQLRGWLERFLFGGDNRNLKRVFVQGVVVGGTDKGCDGGKAEVREGWWK